MSSFSQRPTQDIDDGYGTPGFWFYDSNFIAIGNTEIAGIRFENVTIPHGAIINSATLSLKKPSFGDPGGATTEIYGVAEDNASDMQSDSTGRPRTTQHVSYNFPSFTSANTIYTSDDISAVIQEIIDRSGWSSGNALGLLIVGTDHAGNLQSFISYHWDPSNAPLLSITYTVPSGVVIHKDLQYAVVTTPPALTKLLRYSVVDLELNPVSFVGLKVAKDGHNALNTNKPESFNFISDRGTLKYFDANNVTFNISEAEATIYSHEQHITHNLGYFPFAIVYAQDSDMAHPQPLGRVQVGSGKTRQFSYYMTKTGLYFVVSGSTSFTGGGGDTYDVTFYYKLFKNNLGL